jgi:hypothetical protein
MRTETTPLHTPARSTIDVKRKSPVVNRPEIPIIWNRNGMGFGRLLNTKYTAAKTAAIAIFLDLIAGRFPDPISHLS